LAVIVDSKVGEGLKFRVYEASKQRVKKKQKSSSEVRKSCLYQDPLGILLEGGLDSYAQRIIEARRESLSKINSLVSDNQEVANLLGNPEFDGDVIYQDECRTFGQRLRENPEEYKRIIEDVIELTKECWKYGFADRTYNFTVNYGYNKENQPVLIDFDELTFSKERISEDMTQGRWKTQMSGLWEIPLIEIWKFLEEFKRYSMREYYFQRMEEELNQAALDDLWRSELD